ncbi:hypothetical protein GGS20DRAFT_547082, partial [Poronia punctata]
MLSFYTVVYAGSLWTTACHLRATVAKLFGLHLTGVGLSTTMFGVKGILNLLGIYAYLLFDYGRPWPLRMVSETLHC